MVINWLYREQHPMLAEGLKGLPFQILLNLSHVFFAGFEWKSYKNLEFMYYTMQHAATMSAVIENFIREFHINNYVFLPMSKYQYMNRLYAFHEFLFTNEEMPCYNEKVEEWELAMPSVWCEPEHNAMLFRIHAMFAELRELVDKCSDLEEANSAFHKRLCKTLIEYRKLVFEANMEISQWLLERKFEEFDNES